MSALSHKPCLYGLPARRKLATTCNVPVRLLIKEGSIHRGEVKAG